MRRAPISTYIVSSTTLESIRKVTIYSRLNALVQEILVEEGSLVEENQVLARLEDREVRNEFEQAQLAVEQAALSLQQMEVRAQLSATNYERALTLWQQNLISKQEFDQSALTQKTDDLAYQAAQQQYEAAKARLEAARIQLEYTEIRSSIGGVVTQRMIHVGDRVNVNQAVFVVEDFNPLWARIFVPEKDLPRVRPGQRARLVTEAFPERQFEARVQMINPTVEPASGTVKVTLEVREHQNLLRPGMFSLVYLPTQTHPDALVIPRKAIVREREENRVYVIREDNTVEQREIQVGFSEEDRVEILAGLREGEAVVTVGHEGLSDGYAVQVLEWEGPGVEAGLSQRVEQPAQETRARAAAPPPSGERPGVGRRGGDPNQFFERLMQNPEIRKAYQERLAEDPELATDPEKRRTFFREMMQKLRENRGQP